MTEFIHPFESLKDEELRIAAKLVKDAYPGKDIHFAQIDRADPPKSEMLKYLELEKTGKTLPVIPRVVYCYYYTDTTPTFNKALVNVTYKHVITKTQLPKGVVGPTLIDDGRLLEQYGLNHPIVKAEIAKLKLPPGFVAVSDNWIYGTDDPNETRLLNQFYMYLRVTDHVDSNHYSLPLAFSPVFEVLTRKFVRMDYLPTGLDEKTSPTFPWHQVLPIEYHPDLIHDEPVREMVKPLIVQQPEGASFTISSSNKVQWQGWEFYVASNAREGFAIYDIHFLGRSIIYRLSLSEMTVPYGDPRLPYHRKQAFDLGDCGFGISANSLGLGCDCLGLIKYLDLVRSNGEGDPILKPNTVCLHEQDAGILYKHTNYRTDNAVVTRRREFVVQTIATVGNYEYILNVIFNQAGEINLQVRATGILSTMPIDEGNVVDFGTNVGPTTLAGYHQHLLSFRIDPAIDGHANTVCYDDVYPMAKNTALNPYNVGFESKRSFVEKAGFIEQSPFTNRAVKIINENVMNKITKRPVGYKIEMPARQMILADKDSYNVKRAKFATELLWVTKYEDDRLYAAGEFTNQSKIDTGIAEWANEIDPVRNEDIIVWPTMAFTHCPRLEDFPVMPVEIHQINIVPFGFFEKNPALDIPMANNNFNKSVLIGETGSAAPKCCSKV